MSDKYGRPKPARCVINPVDELKEHIETNRRDIREIRSILDRLIKKEGE